MSHAPIIVCPHCNQPNRLPANRWPQDAATATCGRCKAALFNGTPIELTAANFDAQVGRSGIPVVVDFWAAWCGPCRMMAPVFSAAAGWLEPSLRLAKLDTEREQALAARFDIRSIPSLLVFKEGQVIDRRAGALDLAGLIHWLQPHRAR